MNLPLIITVCDQAAGESCPWFGGHAAKAHLGMNDPSAVQGSDEQVHAAYEFAYALLVMRMQALASLDVVSMEQNQLMQHLSLLANELE